MRYYTTDCIYEIQLQARGLGKRYAEETLNKLKEVYKGGYTHAKPWRKSKMTIEEFKNQLNGLRDKWGEDYNRIDPTPEEYKVIEYVYTWYPTIDNVFGKREIANLYYFGGMGVILNMVDTASEYEDLTNDYRHASDRVNAVKREIEAFRHNVTHNLPKFIK